MIYHINLRQTPENLSVIPGKGGEELRDVVSRLETWVKNIADNGTLWFHKYFWVCKKKKREKGGIKNKRNEKKNKKVKKRKRMGVKTLILKKRLDRASFVLK